MISGFLDDMSIVNGVYKPTYSLGGSTLQDRGQLPETSGSILWFKDVYARCNYVEFMGFIN